MNPLDFTLSAKIEILSTKLNFNTPDLVNVLSWQHCNSPSDLGCNPLNASKCSERHAPNATLRLSTNITNAAIATQVDQLVAFIAPYEFLLHES